MARAELVVLLAAEREIQLVFEDLEERREGSGNELLKVLGRTFERLQEHPESAPLSFRGYRRMLLRAYYRGIFYRVEGRRVVIADLIDLRQDPATIQRRLGR